MLCSMLSLKNVGLEVDSHKVFDNVSFHVNKSEKIGLVGVNGIGKTILLNLIAGNIEPSSGEIQTNGLDIGFMPQDLRDWEDKSVYNFIGEITGIADARRLFEDSCKELETNNDEQTLHIYSKALDKYTRYEVGNFEYNLENSLNRAGLSNIDINKEIGSFSGGQKTRIALAALLSAKYDVMLLDEPTNSLDEQGIVILEKFIGRSKSAFVMVSHDRRFLRNATNRIIELIGGNDGVRQYMLGYDEYIEARGTQKNAEIKRYQDQEKEKKRIQNAAKESKIRANSGGSKSKSDNDKMNNNFRGEKAGSKMSRAASSLVTRLGQMELVDEPKEDISLDFSIDHESDKRKTLIDIKDFTVKYDNSTRVLGPLSLRLDVGEKIAITGDNGVGKSSLLKGIIGSLGVNTGERYLSDPDSMVYIDQLQSVPLRDKPALDNILELAPDLERHEAINLLLKFNLSIENLSQTPAINLSGGERAKILLASIVAKKANLLILDEPTNNLDIPTIEALEKAIKTYKGGILVVSHDRDFLINIGIDRKIIIR